MDAPRRTHFEKLLLAERARLVEVLARLRAAVPAASADGDPPPGEERDAGAAGIGREDDAAVATRATRALEDIETTLRLLYEDPTSYGLCRACGQPIATDRLAIVPAARYCGLHAGDGASPRT